MSTAVRILGIDPGLGITGPQDFPHIIHSILWAMSTAIAFALLVRWRVGERAQPFLVAAAFIAAQMVAMGLMGDLALVRSTLTLIGQLPSALVLGAGFAAGALTSWAGWNAGKKPRIPAARGGGGGEVNELDAEGRPLPA